MSNNLPQKKEISLEARRALDENGLDLEIGDQVIDLSDGEVYLVHDIADDQIILYCEYDDGEWSNYGGE